jgi:hypothetical protein
VAGVNAAPPRKTMATIKADNAAINRGMVTCSS